MRENKLEGVAPALPRPEARKKKDEEDEAEPAMPAKPAKKSSA